MAIRSSEQRRLIVDTLLLGVAGAVWAWVFQVLLRFVTRVLLVGIAGYVAPGLPSEGDSLVERIGPHGLLLIPVLTTLGGLAVGILTNWLAPEVEGQGTDAVIHSFHREGGKLPGRAAPASIVSAALTIGSGGSAGREGTIALATAALGSWYADFTDRSEKERRLLLIVGVAAGISAIFRSPIGAALFSVEVLYADMEFESSVLLYSTLAAIVAFAVSGLIGDYGTLFTVPADAIALPRGTDYLWYALLGVGSGIFATALPVVFYRIRDGFRALPGPRWIKPAIGGLLTGLVGLALPQILSGGYGWMQLAINGQLALGLLLMLAVAKMVTLSFTVGSGGSGGIFAPSLYVGGMVGAALAAAAGKPAAPFTIVGMAAVFAGAAHVPFATMMMVTEMTGGYLLLVPAALAVLVSYLVQRKLSQRLRYHSIDEAQVRNRGESPAHHTHHLEIALRILREKQVTGMNGIGNLDLVSLLRSGVPVDIGGGRQLFVGRLRAASAFTGSTVADSGRKLAGEGTNIIAILRGEHMMAPRADTTLESGDRLVLVAAAEALDGLKADLDVW